MAFAQTQIWVNEEVHQTHHLALAGGVGWHKSEDSAFLGIDYFYTVSNSWGLGAFYEEVNGDFNLQAWGVLAKVSWGHGVRRQSIWHRLSYFLRDTFLSVH